MKNEELLEKLNFHLNEVSEMLALGDLELLKSEELHNRKNGIEDALKFYKNQFGDIEARKIDRAIPMVRNLPKTGIFLSAETVNSGLRPLHTLLQELIKAKGGTEQVAPVTVPELKITGSTINQAINDARTLLETQGATSAVDRVHTVLHGYLKQVCNDAGFPYSKDATLNELMKILKDNHPALSSRDEHTEQILNSMANVLHHLNPIRNNASLAHANSELLKTEEAVFVINTVNTLLSYLNSKF
jgi:hypothetical protein